MEQETGEGEEMEARQRRRQPLVVAGQPEKAGGPREIAPDDPAVGQQNVKVMEAPD